MMKEVETIQEGAHFSAVTVGPMERLGEYVLTFGAMKIPGKVFVGSALHATGAELSFERMQPGATKGFLHTHKTHEELYMVIQGAGEFQVDGTIFAIGEGSVVRVAPEGRRSIRNTGSVPMVVLCVQYKADTFEPSDASDGVLSGAEVW